MVEHHEGDTGVQDALVSILYLHLPGFSTAAMALAARINFSQVFFKLMMLMPSVFFLKMYCSIVVSELSDPMWVVAASILVMSSS